MSGSVQYGTPTPRSWRDTSVNRVSEPEALYEAGNRSVGFLRDPVAYRQTDELIDQRRILDNWASEASRFGEHLIAITIL